ncbi:Transcription factor, fungi, partial [Metarhizium hybridum]
MFFSVTSAHRMTSQPGTQARAKNPTRDIHQTNVARDIGQDAGCDSLHFQQYDESLSKDYRNYTIQASPPAGFAEFDQRFDSIIIEDGCSPAFDHGNTPSDGNATVYSQSLDATLPFNFRGSGFDWLDFDISNIHLPIDSQPSIEENVPPPASVYGVVPSTNPMPSLPALPKRQNVLPWPFEQGKESQPPRFPLPRLHDVLRESTQLSPGDQQTPVDCLVQLFSQQQLPSQKQVASRNLNSGVDLMNQLIDSYFSGFQIIQPIVHAPTWTIHECPTVLLAAMVCVGSALSTDPGSSEVSDAVGEFCASMITWLGVSDSANYSNISYLAALCLHQIYSLGSGNRHLYQNADRTRGVLIGSLRGLGLLNARLNIQDESADSNRAVVDQSNPYAEWKSWITRERDNRIAWASFEYDCSLCTLTNRRGAVDLSELPARLPCSESLWEAPSAHAWVALKFRCPPKAQGAKLSSVLKAAMAGKPVDEHVSMWGRRLCGQVIGRLLWDLKQLEALSTTDYFDLPSLFKAHQHSKTSLLRGLDSLLESMEQPCSTSDLVSYKYDSSSFPCHDNNYNTKVTVTNQKSSISSLLCHYSHMYAADDIMDIVLYMVRKIVSHGPEKDKSVAVAKRRLSAAMKADKKRTRRLLWHSGQIIAVANEFLVSAPCEIMRLFMAYIFVVAYVKYSPSSLKSRDGVYLRLDIHSRDMEQKKAVMQWIQTGGPVQIGSADDIFTEGSAALITRDAQSIFQRLGSWGLADKFAKILQSFENHNG